MRFEGLTTSLRLMQSMCKQKKWLGTLAVLKLCSSSDEEGYLLTD